MYGTGYKGRICGVFRQPLKGFIVFASNTAVIITKGTCEGSLHKGKPISYILCLLWTYGVFTFEREFTIVIVYKTVHKNDSLAYN